MAKVLLVEDDNNLREIYQARLTAEGYDIVAAQNGEDALVLAKQHHPDLVISDVMMPRISGYEMLDILRNTDELKHTKVIMLTALGQNEDKERAGKLGADKYLVKSQVTLEDIVNSAKALLADDSVGTPLAATPDPADPLGMASSAAADDAQATAAASAVSSVAPNVTPLSQPTEPAEEPAVAPEIAQAPEVAVAAVAEPVAEPTPAVEAPSPAPTVETEQIPSVTQEAAEPAITEPQTVEAEPVANPVTEPVSVDDLINGDPEAAQAVAEAAQADFETVQSTDTEQAAVEQQIESFNQTEVAPTAVAQPEVAETPEPTPTPPATVAPQNDEVLNDALQSLTTAAAPAVEPASATTAPEPEAAPVPEPHQIEGLSGVTEVVEVPTETHVDPAPSTTATVIQPVVTTAEPAQLAPEPAPTTAPMTQTVTPTELPPAPVEETPSAPENDGVNVVGKKVIQPLSDPNAKPDLDKLLAQEEAKQSGEVLPQPTVGGAAPAAPAAKPAGFDPNNIAL